MNKIHELFKENPLGWGMYFLNEHFRSESPAFHLSILRAILENKKTAIGAPRGSGKTTLINLLIPAHGICFKRFRNIVIIQASEDKSIENLATLKEEFSTNEQLKVTYKVTFDRDNQRKTVFKHPDGFRTQVTCFGREQIGKVRGAKFGAYRPDLIIIDDLEDDEMVRTRELREELHRKYEDSIEPAIDTLEDYKIIYIDTMKHYDSQLAKMLNPNMYKEYKKLKFAARYDTEEGHKSLWPEKWSIKFLNDLEKDSPIKFAKEYQNDPITGSTQQFSANDLRRWTILENDYVLYDKEGSISSRGAIRDCRAAIGVDLAWEEKRRHDSTAIVPCLITPDSQILVDTYVNDKGMRPDKLAEIMFSMNDKYYGMTKKMVYFGFEKGKYEKVSKWYLEQEYKKRNKFLNIKDMPWVTDKIERIVTPLQPRYAQNMVFHRKDMGDLETQLLRFPSGTHDDLPDALQMAVRLLSDAPTKVETKEESEDPYFDELRKNYLVSKQKPNKKFVFGKKKSRPGIPARKTLW